MGNKSTATAKGQFVKDKTSEQKNDSKSHSRDTKIIVVCNNKGGVGKTTCTAGIGDILARKMNKTVLLIDADPQGNLSKRFGYSPRMNLENSYDVLLQADIEFKSRYINQRIPVSYFYNIGKQFIPTKKTYKDYANLKIMCANGNLENIYSRYRSDPEHANRIIRKFLGEIRESGEFDYVLIDTQPTLSYLLSQYMLGADYVLVPVTPDDDTFDGAEAVGRASAEVAEAKAEYREDNKLDFLGIFFNMVKKNTKSAKEFQRNLPEIWGDNPVFDTMIPQNQDAHNAGNDCAPVTSAYPSSSSSKALEKLTKEIIKRIEEGEE